MAKNKDHKRRIQKLKRQKEGRRILIISVLVTVLIMIILYFSFTS